MRPETVESKVTIAGVNVAPAIQGLPLEDVAHWGIVFCEDVTAGARGTPLLDLGVILRARKKSATKGDSTVKLRPARWSQLDDRFFADSDDGETEVKIQADWAGDHRSLAASMTVKWSDGRMSEVQSGAQPAASLFSRLQRDYLAACSDGRVNLAALVALPAFDAARWDPFDTEVAGVGISVRAERWTLDGGFDFLELSIVSDVDSAEARQAALQRFVASQGLVVDQSATNKTETVLRTLVDRVQV
jgi:hypothetical protein